MNRDEEQNQNRATAPAETTSGGTAVNSLILDYYKKFGRKRDLEQYFSLSTAQSDVKDTSGTFWQRMKSENDSSDSGEKKSDSSQELCRISIRCSVPDPCSSQYHAKSTKPILTGSALLDSLGIKVKSLEEDSKPKSDSVSPPIITEDATHNDTQNSDDESLKSYGNNSQKSFDVLDTSTNKPHSPTSSITSQRKLEWDSLADVGYANESDRKTSASSLSTLERLALKQQYSNSDTKLDSILEPPTAHSTPLDENENKTKSKKGVGKKSTKIYKKDIEYLEVNVPQSSENNPPQTINVNLTKHISFNVEKDGKVTIENTQKDVSPEKNNDDVTPRYKLDKEMQTSSIKSKESPPPKTNQTPQKIPVLISLNTLKRQTRKKKLRLARRKLKSKKKADKESTVVQEKSGEQLSEAESFEYMPGHMYNQNQLTANEGSGNTAGNKSSLESSGLLTTDSSKGSKHSFAQDLEKSIDILRAALQRGGDETNLRKQLIKQVCERLLKSKYRDDESSTDFLSGLSFSSKKLGLGTGNHTTTSTSDNSGDKSKRPKKSILRSYKFNAGAIASTSQSAPNLPTTTNSEKLVSSNLMKNLTTSNTDSDLSHKEKSSSENVFAKTSSQELYQRYLDALKREEAYKQHLKDKEMFLKQKLVCSDSAIRASTRSDPMLNNKLKDLIKDLTRNNYDDGSGDASKLEGGPNSSRDFDRFVPSRTQRSHSVFTLSSCGNSDQCKKQNLKKRLQIDLTDLAKPGTSGVHCCCKHHSPKSKACVVDSSVQVNIERPCDSSSCERRNPSTRLEQREIPSCMPKMVADEISGDIKYVCLCNNKTIKDVPDDFLIFKCSRLAKNNQEAPSKPPHSPCRTKNVTPRRNKDPPCGSPTKLVECPNRRSSPERVCKMKTTSKSSQTNFLLKMMGQQSIDPSSPCNSKNCSRSQSSAKPSPADSTVFEATRCLQTEISINPRIPEPSLSDINIVTECAYFVGESRRLKPKASITDIFSRQENTGTSCNSGSSKSTGTSKDIGELFYDDDISEKAKTFEPKEIIETGNDPSEKFNIPIQGTNMTLMVSIGSSERKNKPENMIGQCIGTERNAVAEQGTSVAEECSKGVQYDPLSRPSGRKTDHNSNNVGVIMDRNINTCAAKLNTCLSAQDPTFNTYPKTSPVNDQKPFRRANTDTDNFRGCTAPLKLDNKCTDPQQSTGVDRNKCNENIKRNQCEIVSYPGYTTIKTTSAEKETQYSEVNIPQNIPQCSCNNADHIKKCNNNCVKLKKNFSSQLSCTKDKTTDNKDYTDKYEERTQTLVTNSVQCQCGCARDMDNCDEKYTERTGTIHKCNVKQSNDEVLKSLTVDNVTILDSSVCSCGCGGVKDKCSKNCNETKKSMSTQCSCGCSGDIVKCNTDCDERKKSLTKENLASATCSCGCNGNINECIETCDERKKSFSSQCPCGCSGDKAKCSENCEEREKIILKEIGIQKDSSSPCSQTPSLTKIQKLKSTDNKKQNYGCAPSTSEKACEIDNNKPPDKCKTSESETEKESDPILEMIKNITKRYSKNDVDKGKKKKCFKEIMTVLNYLLETEDSANRTDNNCVTSESNTTPTSEKPEKKTPCVTKKPEKPSKSKRPIITESSDCPLSTDIPGTSSDSATCKVLNKIKKECERYHQKRCKTHSGKKCDISSSTSTNCEQCKRVHHCACRNHKCKTYRKCEKIQKKAVAYNLLLQTTESISEETVCNDQRPLKNIVVKVPSQKNKCCNVPFKEMCTKIENKMHHCSPRQTKAFRSKSLPNESEISSMEEFLRKSQACCTVRDYLEQNRPDFIAKSSQRQDCLRIVSDTRNEDPCCTSPQLKMIVFHKPSCAGACNNMYQYQAGAPMSCVSTQCYDPCNEVTRIASMRAAQRDLLSVRLAQLSDVNDLDAQELRRLATDLGRHMRQKPPAPKFISERAMKKHSENIYKSLPEVIQKKEEARKESIKKTNLLMAHIFKKNLQKKTLRGSVDISNYSQILKI